LKTRIFVILALALAVGLATAVSPFASSNPDGLQHVAEKQGFLDEGKRKNSPLAGYAFPGVHNERVATGLAGFTGTIAVFALGYGLAFALRRRERGEAPPGAPA